MDKEYSGNMIVELMSTVGKIVPQLRNGFGVDAEQRGVLTQMRQVMLGNGREPTPLKSAWLSMIDHCLSDSPSPELVFAAMKDVLRLSPSGDSANGCKATGVSLM